MLTHSQNPEACLPFRFHLDFGRRESGRKVGIILLITFIFFTFNILSAEKVIIRIENANYKTAEYFYVNNYDIAAFVPEKYLDIVIPEENLKSISNLGYKFKIIKTESQMKENMVLKRKDIFGYRSYDDMVAELDTLVINHPDILQIFDIGDTRGKEYFGGGNNNYIDYQHDIWCVKLSDNVVINEDEPNICFDGEHHAREPISMEMVMLILNYLVDNYETNPDVTFWVDNAQIWFVPLINPNGHKIVIDQTDLWWRKNICDNDGNGQITWGDGWNYPDGVDPNRNYGPEYWFGGAGTSGPSGQTYCGPFPFSEPETSALRNLLQSYKFVTAMSYHSYSELIMWPLGFNMSCVAPDEDALSDLGIEMALTVPSIYGGYYTPQQTNELYTCSGTTTDFGYGVERIFYFITELGVEFIPPASTMEMIINDNLSAALILIDRVFYSTITGNVTDSLSGIPIKATVEVPSIDNTGTPVEPYHCSEDFGRYYRILLPGTYDLEFSAFGYESKYFEDVVVTDDEQTILDVQLSPGQTINVRITVNDSDGEPIPGATIIILDTPLDTLTTNSMGQVLIRNMPLGEYQVSIYASSYGTYTYLMDVTETAHNFTFVIVEPFWIDDFEGGLDNWTAEYPWGITNSQSWSGDCSVTDSPGGNYTNSRNSKLTLNEPSDFTYAISAHVEFATKYDIEQGYDFAYFEISTDGSNWNTLAYFTGIQTSWTEESIDLIDYCGNIVYFRFRFYSDTYVTEDGIYIDDFKIYKYEVIVSTDDTPDFVSQPKLHQNFPNPFSSATTISFSATDLHPSSAVAMLRRVDRFPQIKIYNIKGQIVRQLSIVNYQSSIEWDGKGENGKQLSNGIYFYSLKTGDRIIDTKKCLLFR
ncbi:MAG: carboxypeptidase regulatory-like domain-containing protein [Candidatus Cloacimonetes bacterium]|nr:carboxypeptidase regulatory-like domain-containing protein [Candidatus Cloacimonadota bacterium]